MKAVPGGGGDVGVGGGGVLHGCSWKTEQETGIISELFGRNQRKPSGSEGFFVGKNFFLYLFFI